MRSFEFRVVLAMLLLAGLAGCDGRPRTPKDDLAARVNGTEISAVGLLDQPDRLPQLRDLLALEGIIDRELLVQQARAKGVDRDPGVQQEIEEAKHRILSRVLVERSSGEERLSNEDINAFYRAHPGLFAQRQLFRLNELIVISDPELVAEIRTRVVGKAPGGRRIVDLAGWLQARKVPFRSVALFKASEQLPAEMLRVLAPLAPGDAVVIDRGETTHVVQLLQSIEAPLSLDEARPAIEDMVDEARRAARARALALELRAKARIEYLGAFAAARERLQQSDPSRLPVKLPVREATPSGKAPAAGVASAPGPAQEAAAARTAQAAPATPGRAL